MSPCCLGVCLCPVANFPGAVYQLNPGTGLRGPTSVGAEITPSGATNITAHTVDQRIWRAAKLRWFSPKPADFQQKGSAGTLCVTVATMALPDAGILSQRAR